MKTSKSMVAIIPARLGSKRVPGKNIKSFGGKPMIAWTIQSAIKTKLFKRIIVSTESKEIAKIAPKTPSILGIIKL